MIRMFLRLSLVAAAFAFALVPVPRWMVERFYSQGFYPAIQEQLTQLTNRVPIALFDLAIALIVIAAVWKIARLRRLGLRGVWSGAAAFITFAAVLYLAFMGIWGLNYRRVPLTEKIDYDQSRVTAEAARKFAADAVERLNALYEPAHADRPAGPTLQQAFARAQARLGARAAAVPGRPKRSMMELYFRWAAIDGMTDPFFLEVIVNPDVLPIERPFVIAHEWSHLAGYAVESEASLLAWLTCLDGDALAQYSGWMAIFGQVQSDFPMDERRELFKHLGPGPRQDFAAIAARFSRSQRVVRNVARDTYDVFLRANRVDTGIGSYDEVVQLILGAGADDRWAPRARQ